jgi:Cys-tRNA(Pro) deacylase
MAKPDYPVTPAIRALRDKKIDFIPYQYEYEEKGGTRQTAEVLNVPEHSVVKTLIMDADGGEPFVILMHGDREVSTKELARVLGAKKVNPCDASRAGKATGYVFGGTSPFGTRKQMKVYAEKTIFDINPIYINGGKQGFILGMNPADIKKVFNVTEVEVGIEA